MSFTSAMTNLWVRIMWRRRVSLSSVKFVWKSQKIQTPNGTAASVCLTFPPEALASAFPGQKTVEGASEKHNGSRTGKSQLPKKKKKKFQGHFGTFIAS